MYPNLYKLFAELNNAIDSHHQAKSMLFDLKKNVDNWLSSNAIFLTSVAAKPLWGYHYYLNDLFEVCKDKPLSEEQWLEVRRLQSNLNKFLRAELGIYDTQAAGAPKLDKEVTKNTIAILEKSSLKHAERYKKLEEVPQKADGVS